MENQQLTKKERLRNNKAIESLFNNGFSFNLFPFKIVFFISYQNKNIPDVSQVAFIVPKRLFKKAVSRNNIKRKMKEALRKNKSSLYSVLSEKNQKIEFAILYVAGESYDYQLIETKMKCLLKELVSRFQKET